MTCAATRDLLTIGPVARVDLRFPSRDGECAAWLYLPAEAPGPLPCVVMGHGFSFTRHEGLAPYAERFAEAGIAALVFDYRYFGDSPGQPRQRLRVRLQLEDWRAAVAFARQQDGIDAERVALWGYSYSGGLVVQTAAQDSRIAAALVMCPALDGVARAKMSPTSEVLWAVRPMITDLIGRATNVPVTGPPGSHSALNLPGEEEALLRSVSAGSPWRNEVSAGVLLTATFFRPIKKARRVRCPLWVGLAERDGTVGAKEIEQLAAQAPSAELHRFPLDHVDGLGPNGFEQIAEKQLTFLTSLGLTSKPSTTSATPR
jgi:uncharacterized protein